MNTDKKNQHYIPKFYLRNFSFQSNKKQIGIYNIYNNTFIQKAKLKTQGSKDFFYGYDGKVENILADIEGELSLIIQKVINTRIIPKKNTKDHLDFLAFVALTDVRNPVKVNVLKSMFDGMKEIMKELDSNVNSDKYIPNSSHEEIIEILLSQSVEIIYLMTDLGFKLLINKTNIPFISSDFPVVKYNQFLEELKWKHSKSGYGTVGLQIIIPLNSELAIIFYDTDIYKVGDRKKDFLEIQNLKDVNSINLLQFINCYETIFFSEKATETYIKQLHCEAKKYKRANVGKTELSYLIREGEKRETVMNGRENLMIFGSSDCECKLKIGGIKIHSNGHAYKFDNTVVQLRPYVKARMKTKNSR